MFAKGLFRFLSRLGVNFCAAACAVAFSQHALADLAEVKARGELRHLGVPYANFVTGAGDGLDVEIVQGFARYLGVKHRLVLTDFYSVVDDLVGKKITLKNGQVTFHEDVPVKADMIATGLTILPWRKAILLFSDPVFPSQVLLVARSDSQLKPVKESASVEQDIRQTKALIGKRSLLVMERTCLDPAGYGLDNMGLDLRRYTKSSNTNEMVPALLNNQAELTLLDVPDVIVDLRKWNGKIKVLGPISGQQQLAAAFPKDSPQLQQAFNQYLKEIRQSGVYDQLVDKYYPGIKRYFPDSFKVR